MPDADELVADLRGLTGHRLDASAMHGTSELAGLLCQVFDIDRADARRQLAALNLVLEQAVTHSTNAAAAGDLLGYQVDGSRGERLQRAARRLIVAERTVRRREPELLGDLAQAVWAVLDDAGAVSTIHTRLQASPLMRSMSTGRAADTMSPATSITSDLQSVAAGPAPLDPHWRAAARGSSMAGHDIEFTGRETVLADVAAFSTRQRPGLCVVTGMPGAGKSAVLSVLVLRAQAPDQLPPRLQSIPDLGVAVAAHARDRTAEGLVVELAAGLDVAVPADPAAARTQLMEALQSDPDAPALLVIDAVDEAADPDAVTVLVHDLARRARVVIGVRLDEARPADGTIPIPRLLRTLHPTVLDLDRARYNTVDDVAAYVTRRLRSDERPGGYGAAGGWTRRLLFDEIGREVGRAAGSNFLVAQFMTEELLDREPFSDVLPGWSRELQWPSRVEDWMRRGLDRRLPADRRDLREILRPLGFAQRDGLPVDLWTAALNRFRAAPTGTTDIGEAAGRLGFFLSVTGGSQPRFALRHESFAEYFRSGPMRPVYTRQMYDAVLSTVPVAASGMRRWDAASDYVRRNLLAHAHAAGAVDELLTEDPACLAAITLDGAAAAFTGVKTPAGQQAATTFRRAAYSGDTPFPARLAALQFHAALAGAGPLAHALATGPVLPAWSTPWRAGGPPAAVPLGMPMRTWWVRALQVDGRAAVAVVEAGGSCTVRDAATRVPLGPAIDVSDGGVVPESFTAWTGGTGSAYLAVAWEDGRVPVWLATGPDAALDVEVELRPDPPVRHTAAVRGPGGVDLLWLSTGAPGDMTVWTPRRTAGEARLFHPVPGAPDFAVQVTADDTSASVLTLDHTGSLSLWSFPADLDPIVRELVPAGRGARGVLARGLGGAVVAVVDHGEVLAVHRWDRAVLERTQPKTVETAPAEVVTVEIATGGPLVRAALCLRADATAVIAAGDSHGGVRVWHVSPAGELQDGPVGQTGEAVRALQFLDRDGHVLAVGGWGGAVRVLRQRGATLESSALLNHGEHLIEVIPLGDDGGAPLVATRSAGRLTKFWQLDAEPAAVSQDEPTAFATIEHVESVPLSEQVDVVATITDRTTVDVRLVGPDAEHGLPRAAAAALSGVPGAQVFDHGERPGVLALAAIDGGGAVLAVAGDAALSVWIINVDGSVGATWHVPTDEQPIEHLAVAAGRRAAPVVVMAGPEGLQTVLLDTSLDVVPTVVLADAPVNALSVYGYHDEPESSLVVAGTDDGVLAVVTLGPTEPWQVRQYETDESLTHAFVLNPASRQCAETLAVAVNRVGRVTVWDITAATDEPAREFQNLTPIVLARGVRHRGRPLLALVDLTGALRLLDVLRDDGPVMVLYEPALGGQPTRLLTTPDGVERQQLLLTDTTGRVRVVDLDDLRSTVLDLNCDLTGLTTAVRRGWLVGAFGAAVFGLATPDA